MNDSDLRTSNPLVWRVCQINLHSLGLPLILSLKTPSYIGTLVPFQYATLMVFAISMAIFYPWGVISGFKKQFDHPEFTRPVLDELRISMREDFDLVEGK